jgi:hypothetical protein
MDGDVEGLTRRVDHLDDRLDDVGALAAAFSGLQANSHARGRTQFAVAAGTHRGSAAVAAGFFQIVNEHVMIDAGLSAAFRGEDTAANAGSTFSF